MLELQLGITSKLACLAELIDERFALFFAPATIPLLQDGKRRRPFGRNDNSSRENAQSGPAFANDEDKTPTRSQENA
jgi:hypothetical protein